jgi:hypothetical protein
VQNNKLETLKLLYVWAEEMQLNPNEPNNKLSLVRNMYGYNVWHRAVEQGSLQSLDTLWIWAMEAELNTDEL